MENDISDELRKQVQKKLVKILAKKISKQKRFEDLAEEILSEMEQQKGNGKNLIVERLIKNRVTEPELFKFSPAPTAQREDFVKKIKTGQMKDKFNKIMNPEEYKAAQKKRENVYLIT